MGRTSACGGEEEEAEVAAVPHELPPAELHQIELRDGLGGGRSAGGAGGSGAPRRTRSHRDRAVVSGRTARFW